MVFESSTSPTRTGNTSVTIIGPIAGLTLTGGDPDGDGGAIQAQGELTLTNCVITNNTARIGGGIHLDGGVAQSRSRARFSKTWGPTARADFGPAYQVLEATVR